MFAVLPVVTSIYGYETWSETLRQEYGLKMCEKRVLRGLFRPRWNEVIEGCTKW
jgi:hypothetical protein